METKLVDVDIKEIHDNTVRVRVPLYATTEEILDAAEEAAENLDSLSCEYNRTMNKDTWTITICQE